MEDEVFEMHEFAVDPQRGAGVGELAALDKALPDRRAGDALVETRQRDTGVGFSLIFQLGNCHTDVRVRR
ncbi:hypothetical protein C8J38_11226 [Rhizobium sp. PP-WC-2G-219]|nr:hypothetical protein C8J38_11226 [Rhizobium sp. PP-WC-2G-219]